MNIEIAKKPTYKTLTLKSKKAVAQAVLDDSLSQDAQLPLTSKIPDFNTIYNELHSKFPEIINLDKPVLLAVGIRKEMSKETGVSNVILKRWIAWYCRKSNYYAKHIQGVIRFHLDVSEAGIVTEKHQEKMERKLEKTKVRKTLSKSKDIDSDNNPTDS